MKKNRLGLFLLLPFLFFSFSNIYGLSVETENIHLGYVKRNSSLLRHLVIRNESEQAYEIVNIINACGLSLKIEKKLIPPRSITEGELQLYTGTVQGWLHEKVTIVYRVKDKKDRLNAIKVNVSWYAMPERGYEVYVLPKELKLGDIHAFSPAPFEFEIINIGDQEAIITVPQIEDGIMLSLPIKVMPMGKNVVKGKMLANKAGEGTKRVILETDTLPKTSTEIRLQYNAVPFLTKGNIIELKEVSKEGKDVVLVFRVKGGEQDIHIAGVEEPSGKRLAADQAPVIIKKGEEKTFYIRLNEREYDSLKNSNIYFILGIKGGD